MKSKNPERFNYDMGISESIDIVNERRGTTSSISEMTADYIAIRSMEKQSVADDIIAEVEYSEKDNYSKCEVLMMLNKVRI